MEYIKVSEAASRMGVSRQCIYQWVEKGLIPGVLKSPAGKRGAVRIPKDFHLHLVDGGTKAAGQ